MKKIVKRGLILILSLMLLLPAGALAADPMTMMGLDTDSGRVWEESAFFVRMEELTGVSFTYQQYTDLEAYQKAKGDVLSSEVLPDVLFKADLTPQEELKYAADGTLIDLAPLLEEHAPNLWALLEEHPEWREAITLPDGKIVALPGLSSPERQIVIWINQAWMTELGLETPTTTEELYRVLKGFLDGDPNGNNKADEIPLLLVSPWETCWLQHAFGIVSNDYELYLDGEGKVRFAPYDDAFVDFLAYVKRLTQDGLLGSEAFRMSNASLQMTESETSPVRIGGMVSFAPYTLLSAEATTAYVALMPLSYEGETKYRDLLGDVWRGTFAITRACDDPAAALKWVDALYAEEAAIWVYAGAEGVDYQYNEDGTWAFMVDDFRTITSVQAESLMSGSTGIPGIMPNEFWNNMDLAAERHVVEQSDKVADVASEVFPLTYVEQDEFDRINALFTPIGKLVDESIAKFATGETPLDDEHIAAFRQELADLGVQDLIDSWQRILDLRSAQFAGD